MSCMYMSLCGYIHVSLGGEVCIMWKNISLGGGEKVGFQNVCRMNSRSSLLISGRSSPINMSMSISLVWGFACGGMVVCNVGPVCRPGEV